MLYDDVDYYISQMTFKEFQEWYKEEHSYCWDYETGNCDMCNARREKILLAYNNAVKTSDKGDGN